MNVLLWRTNEELEAFVYQTIIELVEISVNFECKGYGIMQDSAVVVDSKGRN
jgi:hypothetical protein